MSKVGLLVAFALVSGCGGSKNPLGSGDGAAGSSGGGSGGYSGGGSGGSGSGGASGSGGTVGGGSGGSPGTGGVAGSPGTGGSGGTSGGAGGAGGVGGNPGTGGFGGNLGGLLDGGLGGILDSGLITGCPPNPSGQTCGGQGGAFVCVNPSDGGAAGCLCIQQKWVCGTPGAGDGGSGFGGTPCPDNAATMTCPMQGAICSSGTGVCYCTRNAAGGMMWMCTR
jgi:hypothetical protein